MGLQSLLIRFSCFIVSSKQGRRGLKSDARPPIKHVLGNRDVSAPIRFQLVFGFVCPVRPLVLRIHEIYNFAKQHKNSLIACTNEISLSLFASKQKKWDSKKMERYSLFFLRFFLSSPKSSDSLVRFSPLLSLLSL